MTNEKKMELLGSAYKKLTIEEFVVLSQDVVAKYKASERERHELYMNLSRFGENSGVSFKEAALNFSNTVSTLNNVEA
jgi:hypothetical protein